VSDSDPLLRLEGALPSYGLTKAGLCLTSSVAVILVVGAVSEQILTTTLGGVGVMGLMAAFWSARLTLHGLAHDGCQISMAGPDTRWRGVQGREMARQLTLTGPLISQIARPALVPGFAGHVRGSCEVTDDGWELKVEGARLGSAWLQGFHLHGEIALGLVTIRVWRPFFVPMELVPSRYASRSSLFQGGRVDTARAREQARSSARPGFGLDLRELRDHQPGDPFKHIAWSATARRGRLVSRVFEAHARRSVWIILDASPSMFWGEPGRAPIDVSMNTAFQVAQALVGSGDKVGLIVHDEAVRVEIPPDSGRTHLHRLLQGILEAPHLLHEGNTEMTAQEIVDAVAQWFAAQRGVDLRLPAALQNRGFGGHRRHDEMRVVAAARRWLASEQPGGRAHPVVPYKAYAEDESLAILRAFCRHAGVPLSRSHESRPGGQALGIEAAVRCVLRTRGGPYALLLISDLATTHHLEPLRRAAHGSRRHHHRIVVVCPDHAEAALEGEGPSTDPLDRALAEVDAMGARHGFAAVEAFLRPAGVGVLRVGPRDNVGEVLRGIARVA
jgi:hypothetical protein